MKGLLLWGLAAITVAFWLLVWVAVRFQLARAAMLGLLNRRSRKHAVRTVDESIYDEKAYKQLAKGERDFVKKRPSHFPLKIFGACTTRVAFRW